MESSIMNDLKKDVYLKMDKCIDSFKESIKKISTGRATSSLLDSISIEYYNNIVPLRKISSIVVEDSHTLKINTFDSSIRSVVKKSIMKSNLGLNPVIVGDSIKVFIPVLTEERRKEFIKLLNHDAEKAKISIRNIRREANEKIKNRKKKKIISNDEEYITQNAIQDLTNDYMKKIEFLVLKKKNNILTI
ncbi:ribosome recycling factor [Buchnera aphidicola]|uniref:ribosome recycling factor n=1 Tax=Buchnera aphidicola TaxID=9 RepID=UPI003463A813